MWMIDIFQLIAGPNNIIKILFCYVLDLIDSEWGQLSSVICFAWFFPILHIPNIIYFVLSTRFCTRMVANISLKCQKVSFENKITGVYHKCHILIKIPYLRRLWQNQTEQEKIIICVSPIIVSCECCIFLVFVQPLIKYDHTLQCYIIYR